MGNVEAPIRRTVLPDVNADVPSAEPVSLKVPYMNMMRINPFREQCWLIADALTSLYDRSQREISMGQTKQAQWSE